MLDNRETVSVMWLMVRIMGMRINGIPLNYCGAGPIRIYHQWYFQLLEYLFEQEPSTAKVTSRTQLFATVFCRPSLEILYILGALFLDCMVEPGFIIN